MPLTCDRFASAADHMLPFYNTYMPCLSRMPVDAFAQRDWMVHQNWCHPPPSILGKLVHFLLAFDTLPCCVVYVPYWPAHPWFSPLLTACSWAVRFERTTPPLMSDSPFDYCLFGLQTPLTMWGPHVRWLRAPASGVGMGAL